MSAPEGRPEGSIVAREGQLGRYRLRYRIAQGGMASIYLAELAGTQGFRRWVAIKVMHAHLAEEKSFVSMFLDEARLASQIQHPNVCQVVDFGEEDGAYFIVMEYLKGETVSSIVKRCWGEGGALPVGFSAAVLADVARGLHAAHELRDADGRSMNVVHRDVSPQNMVVLYDGMGKITDFGIARSRSRDTTTQTGMIKGKFAYMSPEQLNGRPVDRRADVWSLGVVLWEATTGKRLFRARSEGETALRIVQGEIPLPTDVRPDYPPALEEIVMATLVREPDERTQSAGDLGIALEGFLRTDEGAWGTTRVGQFVTELFSERRSKREAMLSAQPAEQVLVMDLESVSTLGSQVLARSASAETGEDDVSEDEGFVDEDGAELMTIVDTSLLDELETNERELETRDEEEEPATLSLEGRTLVAIEPDSESAPTQQLSQSELRRAADAPAPPPFEPLGPPSESTPTLFAQQRDDEEEPPSRARLIMLLLALGVLGGVAFGVTLYLLDTRDAQRLPEASALASGETAEVDGVVAEPAGAEAPGAEPSAEVSRAAADDSEEEAAPPEEAAAEETTPEETTPEDEETTPEEATPEETTPEETTPEDESPATAPPIASRRSAPRRPPAEVGEGRLNLLAIPRAEVRLRGRLLGTTPLVNQTLPAGRHRLQLRAVSGGASRTVTVRIRADQTTSESVRLE